MVEIINEIGDAADAGATETVRIPSTLYALVRDSYGSRQKVLDWMLAISVVAVCIWAFWEPLKLLITTPPEAMQPNSDVSGALPDIWRQPVPARVYTYNQPGSRAGIGNYTVPTAVRPPNDPSQPPGYLGSQT